MQPEKSCSHWLPKVFKREIGIDSTQAALVALIKHLDYNIGKVLTHMETNDYLENTIVYFSSDNGGALSFGANSGALCGGKQDMYEGGIKIPACIYWKGHFESKEINTFGMTMDIMPTLCEITGINIPEVADGISLLAALNGEGQITDDRYVYWMRREGGPYR